VEIAIEQDEQAAMAYIEGGGRILKSPLNPLYKGGNPLAEVGFLSPPLQRGI
jgi:hypothetical protein